MDNQPASQTETAAPVRPGQFNIRRSQDNRNRIQELQSFKINNIDEAVAFLDTLEKKIPEVKQVLKNARINQVYAANRAAAPAPKAPLVATVETIADTSGDEPTVKSLTNLKPAPKVATEADRLSQLRAASQIPDAAMTGPDNFAPDSQPAALETPEPIERPETAEERKERIKLARQEQVKKMQAAKAAKKAAREAEETKKAEEPTSSEPTKE